jgi:hypothetical protein
MNATFGEPFGQPDTEDKKLRKDLTCLEVLALKVPFGTSLGKSYCFPNEVPWPGQLRTLLLLSEHLDAGRDQEFHKNDRRSHTSALGELFIADEWGRVQGGILRF